MRWAVVVLGGRSEPDSQSASNLFVTCEGAKGAHQVHVFVCQAAARTSIPRSCCVPHNCTVEDSERPDARAWL